MNDQLIQEILGTKASNWLARSFNAMDEAENMIAKWQKRHPAKADVLWDSFLLIRPTGNMSSYAPELWRKHAEELLNRLVNEQELNDLTNVELLLGIVEASKMSPLTHDGYVFYTNLFRDLFKGSGFSVAESIIASIEENNLNVGATGQYDHLLVEVRYALRNKLKRHKPNPERWHKMLAWRAERAEAHAEATEPAQPTQLGLI